MKTLFLAGLFFVLTITSAVAITDEELLQADETLRQMDGNISVLRGYVQVAYNGVVEGVTLTAEQKQELKDNYLAEKSILDDLYKLLP